ncbi:MAG: histidine phosphatase family protein [Sphingobacterium sp.]|uniref:histidine phosphatase family protein n=1 Tax=Sphingobacterium sp. JB170 TaxID=1434842 RepID=UPI00097F330B|nr:histidine phosphatase family protein [Sphingobacterium sp. JB170]SJN48254.1 Phosphoglycerate mutase family [Sphingobacterium sp. JB170]
MKIKTFYFIRHGQTDLNLRGIVQGKGVDSPLNDTGRKQADAFYQMYKDVPFDKVYTSTLQRTKQTVSQFIADGIPTEEHFGLDEISWGVYEGKEQDDRVASGFQQLVASWKSGDLDLSVETGESPNDLVRRQKLAMEFMLSKKNEETVLICMHGRALRIMLCHLTGISVCKMDDFPHTNTALYVLEFKNGRFTIRDHYNIEHLKDLK